MSQIDAGHAVVGPTRYRVTETHGHQTLKIGDIVVMGEDPIEFNNLLIREDYTLHKLFGQDDQYVHLEKVAE